MKCEICNKEIKGDSQFINGAYYHNMCLEQVIVAYKIEQKVLTYTEKQILQNRIDKAIKYYEANQQECVIGRNKDGKLIKEYYLPAQCSKKMLDILKESGE